MNKTSKPKAPRQNGGARTAGALAREEEDVPQNGGFRAPGLGWPGWDGGPEGRYGPPRSRAAETARRSGPGDFNSFRLCRSRSLARNDDAQHAVFVRGGNAVHIGIIGRASTRWKEP